MTDFSSLDPVFQAAAQQYQLDPALLKAQALVESSGDPGAVNQDTGATGLMQMIPATAKSLGVDPTNPQQSIYGAAALMRQNLDRYLGDVEKAVSAYHGGTDPSNWGPKTQAYVGKVADAFNGLKQNGGFVTAPTGDQAAADPLAAMLAQRAQGQTVGAAQAAAATGPASDPISDMLAQRASGATIPGGSSPGAGPMGDLSTTQLAEPTLGTPGRDFLNAAAQHMAKIPVGVAQLAANALLPPSITGPVNDALSSEEKAYQDQTPNSASSYGGPGMGEIAPFFLGLGARLGDIGSLVEQGVNWTAGKLPLAGQMAPVLGRSASGAAQAATYAAAAQPVTQDGSYWSGKADQVKQTAMVGGAIPAGAAILGGIASSIAGAAAPFVSPQSVVRTALNNWVGSDASQVAQALRNAPQYVPGSMPTTAQVAGSPTLVQVEKSLTNNPAFKPQFMERDIANNAARWDAINGVAGTPTDLQAAIAARKQGALQALDPSGQATSIEDFLRQQPPSDAAPVLAKISSTLDSSLGQNPVIKGALQDIKSGIVQNMDRDGFVRPDILDGIRQNASRTLAKYAPNGAASSQETVALAPVQSAIEDAITSSVPGFGDYLTAYARGSAPVNDMEGGAAIAGVLGNLLPNPGGAPQITLSRFASQLNKAKNTDYGFSPPAQATLDGVLSDLQRAAISNSVRAPGSDTAFNLQAPGWLASQLYGSNFGGNGVVPKAMGAALASISGGPAGALGGWLGVGKAANIAGNRVNSELAKALLDPNYAASLLDAVPPGPLQRAAVSAAAQSLLQSVPQMSLLAQQLSAPRR